MHGGELPGTADGINELDVDFWAVESGFAFHLLVWDVHALHSVGESGGGAMPVSGLARGIFRVRFVPIGEVRFELFENKIFYHGESEKKAGPDFVFHFSRH